MRARLKIVAVAGVVASTLVAQVLSSRSVPLPSAFAQDPPALRAATVAIVATPKDARVSSLYLVRTDHKSALAPVATFDHVKGAAVRASVAPDGTTFVVADTHGFRDASFAASLIALVPGSARRVLADRVVHASRALVTNTGRVFVARGDAGTEGAFPGALRVDALSIDEIDVATGGARTVHAFEGYVTFLAGALGDEIFVYRVGPDKAELIAVKPDMPASVRVVIPELPLARDFSIDEARGSLVYTARDKNAAGAWVVERASLATGARTRLHEGTSMSVAPHAASGAGVLWNPGGVGGLAMLGVAADTIGPLGAGVDLITADAPDLGLVAGVHTEQGKLPVPFVLDVASMRAAALDFPSGTRVTVAGFLLARTGGQ